LVGLTERGVAGTFSSGQRSRLRLALAQQHAPDLLLLDEPGAALDAAGLGVIETLVAQGRERGAVVIATNDPRERRFATYELAL
ncbi:ATP-binding cassette domain-containing protein, partial [bacterium]